jgi:hypothetical protein
MKSLKSFIIILFILPSFLFSQPFKTDFKINQDNQPSTIFQMYPKVFVKDANRFLLTWTDYRRGDEKIYAQWYDGNGNKMGGNFEIAGNYDVVFVNDSTFVAVYTEGEYYPFYSIQYFRGKVYINDIPLNNVLNLGSITIPEEGIIVGTEGSTSNLLYENKLFAFVSNLGFVYRTIVTFPLFETIIDTIETNGKAYKIKSEKLITSDYALFFFKDSMMYNTDGLYGNFYDHNGQLISTRKIYAYSNSLSKLPSYMVTNLQDSTYLILLLENSLNKLLLIKLDRSGNQLGIINEVQVPVYSTNFEAFSDIYVSNFKDGKFYVSFYLPTYIEGRRHIVNYLYEFTQNGIFTGNYWLDTTFQTNLTFEKNFLNQGNQNLISGFFQNYDIYKIKLNLFTPISIEKANDDLIGSNENIALMSQKDANTYFVYYSDELGWRGKFISSDGNSLSEEKRIDVDNLQFFSDGSAIGLWKKRIDYYAYYAGFVYYDANMNKIKIDTLKSGTDNLIIYDELISYRILDNSNILIVYRGANSNYARLQTKEGILIKEIVLGPANYSVPKIFKHSTDVYILNFSGKIKLFNSNLDSLSTTYDGDITIYFGNYKYLSHYRILRSLPPFYGIPEDYGIIKTIMGDSLGSISFGQSLWYFKVYPINENYFMITYKDNQNFVAKTYTSTGNLARGPIQINQSVPASRKNLTAYHFNDKIYFFWADTRDGSYDIYSTIYNRGTLTSIEENPISEIDFRLEQNYPNPFNAMTRIKYSIKDEGRVTLKIYDLLGRETALLVDEIKRPGTYEVEFNANNLSSGVYVYQLKHGDKTLSRKLVLLK